MQQSGIMSKSNHFSVNVNSNNYLKNQDVNSDMGGSAVNFNHNKNKKDLLINDYNNNQVISKINTDNNSLGNSNDCNRFDVERNRNNKNKK